MTARIRLVGVGVAGGSGCPTDEGGSIVRDTAMLIIHKCDMKENEGVSECRGVSQNGVTTNP